MELRGFIPTGVSGAEAGWPRQRLVWGGAAASVVCLSALAVRWIWIGRPALLFLAWNLLLAWAPLICNALVAMVRRRGLRRLYGPGIVLDFAWLMFLPNAPYLVTDLIHLTGRSLAGRPQVPFWYDVLLFCSFAATGCWLGLVSLQSVIARVAARFGPWRSWVTAAAVCLLCGYGVYLGRFFRFNSWDVLGRPMQLLSMAFDSLGHPSAAAFAVCFGGFFGMQWVLLNLASVGQSPSPSLPTTQSDLAVTTRTASDTTSLSAATVT